MNQHRQSGLVYLLLGSLLSAGLVYFFQWLHEKGTDVTLYGPGWGLPGALAMIGVVKLFTGVPFTQTSDRWNRMPQWKQTVLGFLLMFLGFGMICAVVATYLYFSN